MNWFTRAKKVCILALSEQARINYLRDVGSFARRLGEINDRVELLTDVIRDTSVLGLYRRSGLISDADATRALVELDRRGAPLQREVKALLEKLEDPASFVPYWRQAQGFRIGIAESERLIECAGEAFLAMSAIVEYTELPEEQFRELREIILSRVRAFLDQGLILLECMLPYMSSRQPSYHCRCCMLWAARADRALFDLIVGMESATSEQALACARTTILDSVAALETAIADGRESLAQRHDFISKSAHQESSRRILAAIVSYEETFRGETEIAAAYRHMAREDATLRELFAEGTAVVALLKRRIKGRRARMHTLGD